MDPFEVIGAFVDGERIDAEALKAALATDEGRQYLVDIALLRELTAGDDHTRAGTTMTPSPAVSTITPSNGATGRRWLVPVAAAAGIVIALTGGYAMGRRAVSASDAREPASTSQGQPAPAPTSIIRLKPGVDWHEQTARN